MQSKTIACLRLLCCLFALTITDAKAAETAFECVAQKQDAGREDASWSSTLLWWDDSRLKMVDKGQQYYSGDDPARTKFGWTEIYGAQSMRGNSFLGFYRRDHFECRPLLD